jgi:membrane protein implicated in regulation of membrane protease activity
MALYNLDLPLQPLTAVSRFHAVLLGTATKQTCQVTSGANQQAVGIIQETISAADITSGRVADVRVEGVSTCVANSAIAIGDRVRVSATEGLLETVAAATAKQNQVGLALTAAASSGDWFEVLLTTGVQIDT